MVHKSEPLVIVVLVFSLCNALIMCVLACMSQWAITKNVSLSNHAFFVIKSLSQWKTPTKILDLWSNVSDQIFFWEALSFSPLFNFHLLLDRVVSAKLPVLPNLKLFSHLVLGKSLTVLKSLKHSQTSLSGIVFKSWFWEKFYLIESHLMQFDYGLYCYR